MEDISTLLMDYLSMRGLIKLFIYASASTLHNSYSCVVSVDCLRSW